MTKSELLAYARTRLDDTVEPYLWSDAELTDYLEDAEMEAAQRAKLIKVTGSATYCQITLAEDTESYALNSLVYDVVKARVTDESYPMERTDREELERRYPNWETESGTPERYFVEEGYLYVHPVPSAAGTVDMTVLRLPANPMGASPEIHAKHHMRLLDWAMHLAYLKRDVAAYDVKRAEYHEQRFERSFGVKWSAEQERRRMRKAPTVMKDNAYYGGE